jgi:hypothetical protein
MNESERAIINQAICDRFGLLRDNRPAEMEIEELKRAEAMKHTSRLALKKLSEIPMDQLTHSEQEWLSEFLHDK